MSPTSPMRPKRTVLPAGFYLIASIALFVFLMVFFIDLVTIIADLVEVPLAWSDFGGIFPQPILTERMIIAVLLVLVIIMFFWSLNLIFTSRKRRK